MSHGRERIEKNCLNCETTVVGRYCHICGQENIEPKETFWGMVVHFFNDITHFDGKFFTTLKVLFRKPGLLSAEYVRGRRMTYLHPIRMYVFTSAIFFLVFFSLRDGDDIVNVTDPNGVLIIPKEERARLIEETKEDLEVDPDDKNLNAMLALLEDTTQQLRPLDLLPYQGDFQAVSTIGGKYTSRAQYDSVQLSKPLAERDGWLKRFWNVRAVAANEKYKFNQRQSMRDVGERVLHRLPYILFISLPFFAGILKLLYIRRRKQFYYADHGIFTVHHYILSFILLLAVLILDKLIDLTGWDIWQWMIFAAIIAWPFYLLFAMKRFYTQRWWKTLVKFFFLNVLGLMLITIIFVIFFLLSIFQ